MRDVTFPTHNPFILRDMLKPEVRNRPIPGKGKLYLPEGGGRGLPGVVLLEGLGGLKQERELAYGEDLAKDGFVVLVIDTFGTRGADVLSDTKRALTVTEAMMLADAFAGLRYLRDHPAVDSDRVGVMGFSYGGMVTVLAAYEQMRRLMAPDLPGFAAHASYYGCSVARLDDPTTTGAPLLIQIGDKDRNVSVGRSREIAEDLRRGGSKVDLVVHDAFHQWDGNDVEKRFVRWSLEDLKMRVDRETRVTLDGVRMPVLGPWSRKIAIAMGVRASGYHILHDTDVEEASYEKLLRFFRTHMPAKPVADAAPAMGGGDTANLADAVARKATG